MKRSLKIFSSGSVYEMMGDLAVGVVHTGGDVRQLRRWLQFTAATHFTVATAGESEPDVVDISSRSGQRINEQGLALVKAYEGLEEKVSGQGGSLSIRAYQDVVNVWTIGYGHTKTARPGLEITPEAAEALLDEDLEVFERAVSQAVEVEINGDQFSALVAFAFNLGPAALFDSTLLKKVNTGDFAGAADEFPRWNKAGQQRLLGLTRRRLSERALFLSAPWQVYRDYAGPVEPAIAVLAAAGAHPATANKAVAAPASQMRDLKLSDPKMQGPDVQQLQAHLKAQGFVFNTGNSFDEITQAVVKEFQRRHQLKADGIVGPATRKALGMEV